MSDLFDRGRELSSSGLRRAADVAESTRRHGTISGNFYTSAGGMVQAGAAPPSQIDNVATTYNDAQQVFSTTTIDYQSSQVAYDSESTLLMEGLELYPEPEPIELTGSLELLESPSFGQAIELQARAAGYSIQNFPQPPARASGQVIIVWVRNRGPFAVIIQNNKPAVPGGAPVLTPTGADATLGAGESMRLTWYPSLGFYAITSGTAGAIGALTTVAGVGGVVVPALAGGACLQLAGLAGQSGDLLQFLSSGGAVLARVAAGGQLTLPASTAASAGLNLGSGTAPTSPSNGDVWVDSSGNLKWQGAGSTHSAGGGGGNANNALTQETGTATTTQTQIFTQTNSNGLHGCFTIKNSSGTTSISVIVSATDAFGNSLTNVTLNSISPNGFLSFDLDNPGLLNSNNVFAPLTTFTLSLKTGSGTAAYDAWFSLVG